MTNDNLEHSIAVVRAAWVESPYYEQAEALTHIFWGESTIFLRLFNNLDLTETIDLACGHGRHAEFVVRECVKLHLFDLVEENLDVCRERLSGHRNVEFHFGNGSNFRPLSDRTVSSIFCYDAMVHFSQDIIEAYLVDAARVLRPGGMALLHHSNYDAPEGVPYGENPHARNKMTQARFCLLAGASGLEVEESCVIDWGGYTDLDCVTLLRKPSD